MGFPVCRFADLIDTAPLPRLSSAMIFADLVLGLDVVIFGSPAWRWPIQRFH
jgi:hypothetical protein